MALILTNIFGTRSSAGDQWPPLGFTMGGLVEGFEFKGLITASDGMSDINGKRGVGASHFRANLCISTA